MHSWSNTSEVTDQVATPIRVLCNQLSRLKLLQYWYWTINSTNKALIFVSWTINSWLRSWCHMSHTGVCWDRRIILFKAKGSSFYTFWKWDYCQGTTVWITDQFQDQLWDQLRDQLWDQLRDHLWLTSDSISDPISGQLCNHHCHDCPCNCLYDCLFDHLCLIIGKLRDQLWDQFQDQLRDQLCIPNSDIAEAQDPGLGLQEAMAKDRRIVQSLIIQCAPLACIYW